MRQSHNFTVSQISLILLRRYLITNIHLRPLHPDRCPRPSIGSEGMDLAEGPEFGGGVLLADQHGVGFLGLAVHQVVEDGPGGDGGAV